MLGALFLLEIRRLYCTKRYFTISIKLYNKNQSRPFGTRVAIKYVYLLLKTSHTMHIMPPESISACGQPANVMRNYDFVWNSQRLNSKDSIFFKLNSKGNILL